MFQKIFKSVMDPVQGGDKVCHWNAGIVLSVAV
jgi:hypothetical protein